MPGKILDSFQSFLTRYATDIFFIHEDCIEVDIDGQFNDSCTLFKISTGPTAGKIVLNAETPGMIFRKYELLQFIDVNISRRISLSQLSRAAGFHPNDLCSRFRQEICITLLRYIDRIPITLAEEYLLWSNMNVG